MATKDDSKTPRRRRKKTDAPDDKTVDELRAEHDLPPLPDGLGEIALNDPWLVAARREPASTPATPAAPVQARVRLRVYVTACGKRMEHLAGFIRMVQRQKPLKRTMAEWEAAYQAYMSTPA